jgi:divalent metal cation (Fe/Co/Zn/Cd) transporter
VILVNPKLDVKDAHDIASLVENKLIREHNVYDVIVHIEPH